jgi:hypothetical protein
MHVTFVLGTMALALLIGTAGSADTRQPVQVRIGKDDVQFRASLDSRRDGYEHAYRDGADRGRFDREHGIPYNLNAKVYRDSARGYEHFMGDKAQYQQGYREGYKAGYDSGYHGVADQYGRMDGRTWPADASVTSVVRPHPHRSRRGRRPRA